MTDKELLHDAIKRGLRYSKLLREVYQKELKSVPSNILLAEIITKDLGLDMPLTATQIAEVKRSGKLKKGKKSAAFLPPFIHPETDDNLSIEQEQAKDLAKQIKENGAKGKMW